MEGSTSYQEIRSSAFLPEMGGGIRSTRRGMSSIILNTRFGLRSYTIRPESPRTKQALIELGIDTHDYHLRDEESFGGAGVPEEIKKIRYEHYKKKIEKKLIEVLNKRKEIISRAKTCSDHQDNHHSLNFMPSINSFTNIPPSNFKIPKSHLQTSSSNFTPRIDSAQGYPKEALETYNKTVSYLRSNHKSPNLKDGDEIINKKQQDELLNIDILLEEEIEKYNRLKTQKQKEAKFFYEEETKKMKLLENLKKREEKMVNIKEKSLIDKEKKKEILKKKAETKLEMIKAIETQYNQKKKQAEEKLAKKMQAIAKRIAIINQEKEKAQQEIAEKTKIKIRKHQNLKQQLKLTEISYCDGQRTKLDNKLNTSQEIYNEMIMSKVLTVKEKLDQENRNYKKIKKKRIVEEQDKFNTMVERFLSNERKLKNQLDENYKTQSIKRREKLTKDKQHNENQEKVRKELNQKMRKYKNNQEKIEQNILMKKMEDEKQLRIRQELRRLRLEDKNENFEKLKRMTDYRLNMLMEKEKINQQKLKMIKSEQEILRKTRSEVAVQSKIEKDRIFEGIEQVSNIMNSEMAKKRYLLTRNEKLKSLKILKSIFDERDVDLSLFKDKPKTNKLASLSVKNLGSTLMLESTISMKKLTN